MPAQADRPDRHVHAPSNSTTAMSGLRSTWPISARELFSRYLVAVEVAGTLLLVALVGAVAIVGQSASRRRPRCRGDSGSIRSTARNRRTLPADAAGGDAWLNCTARQLSGRRGHAVRHRADRLSEPAEHDRHVPLGRDDAARRVGEPGGLGPVSQRLRRPDAGDLHHCRGGLRGGHRPGPGADAVSNAAASSTSPSGSALREANQPPYVDRKLPEAGERRARLAAFDAGRRRAAASTAEEASHRSHV